MLFTSDEQVTSSIKRLDPADRMLLDLSVHRGLDDQILADVLRVDPVEIARRRELVLDAVADQLGLRGQEERSRLVAKLKSLPDSRWPNGTRTRHLRRLWALPAALGVLAVAGVGGALLVSGGGGDGSTSTVTRTRGVPLTRVAPATQGRGEASLAGRRLRLKVSGLPRLEEPYEVWLYNSLTDAVPLGRKVASRFTLEARLPAAARGYRFVDVSREPTDGNPNHSGASVLRAPLGSLLRPWSGRHSPTGSGR